MNLKTNLNWYFSNYLGNKQKNAIYQKKSFCAADRSSFVRSTPIY